MAIPTKDGKYRCSYCSKVYPDPVAADTCLANHNLIYVPFTMAEIKSLISFLYTKNEKNLLESAIKTLLKYNTLRQPVDEKRK